MTIGLFGGSFNPIHNAHIALARTICCEAGMDEVWFLVSPQNPLKKQSSLLDENLRFDMVQRALEGEAQLFASDYEFHLQRPSYTWHTLQHLSQDYPQHKFCLIIGGDNWALFHRWAHSEEILANYDVFVYPREGSEIDEASLPPRVHIVHTPEIDITSTMIRQFLKEGKDVSEYVPQSVCDEIAKHGYYSCEDNK